VITRPALFGRDDGGQRSAEDSLEELATGRSISRQPPCRPEHWKKVADVRKSRPPLDDALRQTIFRVSHSPNGTASGRNVRW
jgi:hypothetical protein